MMLVSLMSAHLRKSVPVCSCSHNRYCFRGHVFSTLKTCPMRGANQSFVLTPIPLQALSVCLEFVSFPTFFILLRSVKLFDIL